MDGDPYDRPSHDRDPYRRDPYDRGWPGDDSPGYRGGPVGPREDAPGYRDNAARYRDGYGDGSVYGDDQPSGYLPARAREERRGLPAGDGDVEEIPDGRRRRRRNMPLWQELPLLLIVAFCLAVLIRTFLLQAFYIPSGSMENTLLVGDRVLVNKIVYDVRDPERGEVIVFKGTDDWAPENTFDTDAGFFSSLGRTIGDLIGISQPGEKDFIKRVIGVPGDIVACCDVDGNVIVNGYGLDESPYLPDELNSPRDREPSPRECGARRFNPVTVQPGQLFVMGDHRLVSQDSRCQGQVPIENVIGRAFVIVWPSGRWTTLGVPATFGKVPKPAAAQLIVGPLDGGDPAAGSGTRTDPATGATRAEAHGPFRAPAATLFALPAIATLAVAARSRRYGWRGQRTLLE